MLVARSQVGVDDRLVVAHLDRVFRRRSHGRSFMTITRSLASMTKSRSCSTTSSVMPSRSRNARDVLEELDAQRRADAGHRLVEKQDARLGHQRADQVEQLPLAAGERPGERVGVTFEADEREQLVRAASRLALARASCKSSAELLARVVRRGEDDVLEDGHPREGARRLERAHEASPGDPVRCEPVDAAAVAGARRPDCARRKPEMQLKSVDLPAPFGPISPVIEPSSTSNVAPSTAARRRSAHDLAHLQSALIPAPGGGRAAASAWAAPSSLRRSFEHHLFAGCRAAPVAERPRGR